MQGISRFFLLLMGFEVINGLPAPNQPNVVIFQVDDMGSYDASYHGSTQFFTPNIDALAYSGVILNRFYTPPMCTPSRSSAMTGKDPHSLGMQHFVILPQEGWGLGLEEKLISNYFQDSGYRTYCVGKWHLGHFQQKYTPTRRGFDEFYGYYNGLVDYFTYEFSWANYKGYDFRRNLDVNYVKNGSYATDVFTDEAVRIIENHRDKSKPFFLMLNHLAPHAGNKEYFQAPEEIVEKFKYIEDEKRRKYAAMVFKVDESLGRVVQSLLDTDLLENTIILFYSDNGAPTNGIYGNKGSNYPFRDKKASPWEGATRNLGFMYSPLIKNKQRVHEGLFHTSDILPTLAGAAGINVGKVDGFNQWDVIVNGGKSPRKEVVNSLDTVSNQYSMISGDYKLLLSGGKGPFLGDIEEFNIPVESYANEVLSSTVAEALRDAGFEDPLREKKVIELLNKAIINCDYEKNPDTECHASSGNPCLYHIFNDPCELTNIAKDHPGIVKSITKKIADLRDIAKPSRRAWKDDKRCDPKLHNGVWSWWIPDDEDYSLWLKGKH